MSISSTLASQFYANAKPATAPSTKNSGGFEESLSTGARAFADVLQHSEETAKSAMIGNADPHALVEALAETELAIETVVAVRNKVVEAYQEILRMQV